MTFLKEEKQIINFPFQRESDWKDLFREKIKDCQLNEVDINTRDWQLTCREIKKLNSFLLNSGLNLKTIKSNNPKTIVSAKSMGYEAILERNPEIEASQNETNIKKRVGVENLYFHYGTLRSGEHLDKDVDILIFGDVNPGAKISSSGNIMIWGRLRGIAHAGKTGNLKAKIISLELRPLQLRIGDQIARGPDERPEQGLAEEARIEEGQIIISPAKSSQIQDMKIYS